MYITPSTFESDTSESTFIDRLVLAFTEQAKQKQRGEKHVMLPCVQGYDTKWIVIDYGSSFLFIFHFKVLIFFYIFLCGVCSNCLLYWCREVCSTCA